MADKLEQLNEDISEIKVSIAKIEVHMERSIPALDQVWKNKDCIRSLKTKQSLVQWIGGTAVVAFVYNVIKVILNKPPHS